MGERGRVGERKGFEKREKEGGVERVRGRKRSTHRERKRRTKGGRERK